MKLQLQLFIARSEIQDAAIETLYGRRNKYGILKVHLVTDLSTIYQDFCDITRGP